MRYRMISLYRMISVSRYPEHFRLYVSLESRRKTQLKGAYGKDAYVGKIAVWAHRGSFGVQQQLSIGSLSERHLAQQVILRNSSCTGLDYIFYAYFVDGIGLISII